MMNGINTSIQVQSYIVHLVRRMAMLIALLLSFVAGARAEVYYTMYYDDSSTTPATRYYVCISEDGNSVEVSTTFTARCLWVRENVLTEAKGGDGKIVDGEPTDTKHNTDNNNNRKSLRSYSHPTKYLSGFDSSDDKASNGTSLDMKIVTSSTGYWLYDKVTDINTTTSHPVFYQYSYKHYVYYDNESQGFKISSTADEYETRAIIETYTPDELPASVVVSNVISDGEDWLVLLSANAGSVIYYTTDGSVPTTSCTQYSRPVTVAKGSTIKAISKNDFSISDVTVKVLPTSNVVTLDDREDHTWSYYQAPSETNPICSPNPRNVQVTYEGGGIDNPGAGNQYAAVGIDAPETSFVYYKTLEKEGNGYPYTTINNPFSKRPSRKLDNEDKMFYGFAGWEVKEFTGCVISSADGTSTFGQGSTIPADEKVILTFTDESENNYSIDNKDYLSANITLTAKWEQANVVRCSVSGIKTALYNTNLSNEHSYERNIIVVNSGTHSSTTINQASDKTNRAATIMMVEPDGSADYSTGRYINPSSIVLYNDLKFEYINLRNNSTTINANAKNLVLGRCITHPYSHSEINASTIRGLNATKDVSLDYLLRIESGLYNTLYFVSTSRTCSGNSKRIRSILGCDYDRARNDDTQMKILGQTTMGSGMTFSGNTFDSSSLLATVKSGTFNADLSNSGTASANQSFYLSMSSDPTLAGSRTLIIEGGTFWNIAGGVDKNGDLLSPTQNGYDKTSVYIRMKGGYVKGSIYGGGAYAEGYGNRKMVFTGGTVGGWIAAGCNGTQTSGGKTYGSSQLYIGGDVEVKNEDSDINKASGGQVFGAGKGYWNTDGTSGEMTYGTTVVIADKALVAGDVYGGGFYGYAKEGSSNVYVLGGSIGGNVYGGSNMKGGAPTNITISGGTVNGDVYGGSNTKGEIASTSITMTGGTVGSDNTGGNIFGGGNQAPVKGNTNVTISGGEVRQNVYGGGNKAAVSGTTSVVIGQ